MWNVAVLLRDRNVRIDFGSNLFNRIAGFDRIEEMREASLVSIQSSSLVTSTVLLAITTDFVATNASSTWLTTVALVTVSTTALGQLVLIVLSLTFLFRLLQV